MLNQNEERLKNNRNNAIITGRFTEEFEYTYTTLGEYFFENKLEVRRRDGKVENITIIASEHLLYDIEPVTRKYVVITGRIETKKIKVEKEKLNNDVRIFAKQIDFCEEKANDENSMYLEGVIEKKITMRKERNYVRIIILAVYKNDKTVNFIPCMFFGKEANRINRLSIGTKIQLKGKIEGRNKLRLFPDGSIKIISIHSIIGEKFNKI